MTLWIIVAVIVLAFLTMGLATLTYALRDYSRPRLEEALQRRGLSSLTESILTRSNDLIFLTAVGRLICNS